MSLVFRARARVPPLRLPLLELVNCDRRRGHRCTNRQWREIVQTDRQTAISKMTANNLCTDNGTRAPSCGYFSPFWERIFHFHASEAHDIYFQTVENGQRRRSGAPTGNRTRTRTPPQVPIDSPSHPSWQKNVTAVVSRRRLLIKWPKI